MVFSKYEKEGCWFAFGQKYAVRTQEKLLGKHKASYCEGTRRLIVYDAMFALTKFPAPCFLFDITDKLFLIYPLTFFISALPHPII